MKWFLLSLGLFLFTNTFSQSNFDTEEELIEYMAGVWNIDSIYFGWIGLHEIPTPEYADSAFVYVEFVSSDVPETPLFLRRFTNGILQEEVPVAITNEDSITFAGYWFLDIDSDNFPLTLIVSEAGYEPLPMDSLITLAEYATDANTYFLSKCFPAYDVHGMPLFMQYLDEDNDGYGLDEATQFACGKIEGYSYESGDCDDMDESINPDAEEIFGNLVDENCDGDLGPTSIDENEISSLEIYPNPTADLIHFRTVDSRKFQVSVYSIHGNLLGTYDTPNKISLNCFPTGSYILKTVFEGGTNTSVRKVIKN